MKLSNIPGGSYKFLSYVYSWVLLVVSLSRISAFTQTIISRNSLPPFLSNSVHPALNVSHQSGPWGPWTEISECSRTCGGGVAFQERICLDIRADGRHSCFGAARKYTSCNTQDCPSPSRDFRSEQCARFNSVPHKGQYHSWIPYFSAQNPCELNCMPKGGIFYARLDRTVIDGTRCRDDGTLDVCVEGQCMPVGCDRILGSSSREDECGVCGGDGGSCKVVRGVLDQDHFQVGYNDILLIPVGATSILIQEIHPTNNYIALRNSAGTFFLNGNWRIEYPREIKLAGTIFYYERKPQGYLAPETLRARGPTLEPIFVVLLYQEKNQGFSYEYSIPATTKSSAPDSYLWTFGDFEECTEECGGGLQYRPVRCIKKSDRDIVDDSLCDPVQRPAENVSCNVQPCIASWRIGDWSECSQSCSAGSQFRLVFCQQRKEGNVVFADETECDEEKPIFMRACNLDVPCDNTTIDAEDLKDVDASKVEWIVSDWSGCEAVCGPHAESRSAHCANQDGVVFPDGACDASRSPELGRPCDKVPMCEPMWHTSEWTNCSAECGMGIQSRLVFCGAWENDSVVKIEDSSCDPDKKFDEMQNCTDAPCNGTWFTGPWNRCTVPCGGGERSRKVLCFHQNKVVDSDACDAVLKPFDSEPCNTAPCDADEILDFVGCKNTSHGCCADGQTAAGPEDIGCPSVNILEKNTTCDDSEFGCCTDNFTLASGPFKKGCLLTIACDLTEHGCCLDNTTVAMGPDFEGCENKTTECDNSTSELCDDSLFKIDDMGSGEDCYSKEFGCCPDGLTEAIGPDQAGCNGTTNGTDCQASAFGCCEDEFSFAKGPHKSGCEEDGGSGEGELIMSCDDTQFGCCPDNVTISKGFFNEGCFPEDCLNSTFGCCPDNATSAAGPGNEGCFPEDCANSTFGCCPDNSTSANGPENEGCFPEDCSNSTFGCCPDNATLATGPDGAGCDTETTPLLVVTTIPPACTGTQHGCCPDGETEALGRNLEGCCFGMRFGCCPDNKTAALGPTFLGCGCQTFPYGCCPDAITPALGFNYHGCQCEHFQFGCCQDGHTPATGPHFDGCVCQLMRFGCCPDGRTPVANEQGEGCGCSGNRFGCCPDGQTPAAAADLTGCPCNTLPYGCCPDGRTPSRSPDPRGCPCHSQQYGCCTDGQTAARGPDGYGCPCEASHFGCCPDGRTPARGPNAQGCHCFQMPHGCCADGYTAARGPRYEGCPEVRQPTVKVSGEVCGLWKESGPCRNFTVMWYFDTSYGSCSRFWYGGCDGNGNKFNTIEECENVCVKPTGPEACFLPKSSGSCTEEIPSWYYDPGSKSCEQFMYGGCSGNNNRFVTKEACEQKCISLQKPVPVDVCSSPKDEGPCVNYAVQWFYNREATRCEQFNYGGCEGNGNRFDSRRECESTCVTDIIIQETEVCRLPQSVGSCSDFSEQWFFDYESGQCHRFVYSGCDGNGNNFHTFGECEKRCHVTKPQAPVSPDFKTEFCFAAADAGPCSSPAVQWHYDAADGVCKEFRYGGCKGNRNRFPTRKECETSCFQAQDACNLSVVKGPCSGSFTQWYFDRNSGECLEFLFSGCQGNANRFNSREACYRRCRRDKLVITTTPELPPSDMCGLPQEPGPCLGYYLTWYYEFSDNMCKQFVYGGCDGNENRFENREACEQQCVKRETRPQVSSVPQSVRPTNEDVCRLAVDPGPCEDDHPRWFYDAQTQNCLTFVYGGCGGNQNRFKTSEICLRFCGGISVLQPTQEPVHLITPASSACPQSNCAEIQCPYGIEETFGPDGCSTCRCSNPCEVHTCPGGSRCVIDVIRTSREAIRTEPICRRVSKVGECPFASLFAAEGRDCELSRCRDDADCRGDHKCCSNGCALICMQPTEVRDVAPVTQTEAAKILPGPNTTRGEVGQPAELPCHATGWPRPTVTWWRDTTMLPLSSHRYQQMPDYALLIRSVVYEDGGDYSCHAHNGIGSGVFHKVTLIIDLSPEHGAASDSEPLDPRHAPLEVRVTAGTPQPRSGAPLRLDCILSESDAQVRVEWMMDGRPVVERERVRVLANHSLLVLKARTDDSGAYSCIASLPDGATASDSVNVDVMVASEQCEDNPSFSSSCPSIVQNNYCNNVHYREYCCGSCRRAGQLHAPPPA